MPEVPRRLTPEEIRETVGDFFDDNVPPEKMNFADLFTEDLKVIALQVSVRLLTNFGRQEIQTHLDKALKEDEFETLRNFLMSEGTEQMMLARREGERSAFGIKCAILVVSLPFEPFPKEAEQDKK